MSIVVTGATGHLGRLIVISLLDRGVPAEQIVAVGRDTGRLADLAGRGVTVRQADYDDPGSLRTALAGAEKLMFVSGSEVGRRVAQHHNVIAAAKEAAVGLVVYTSIPKAETSSLILAAEHRATEQEIVASGLPYVFLRNSWYLENYLPQLPAYLEHGVAGAAGDGRISAATRADFAEAAAAVLTGDSNPNQVYELGGESFTLAELATEVSRQSGREVGYTDLPVEKYVEVLVGAGLPRGFAEVLADGDRGAAEGELHVASDDLAKLIGRPPTTLAEAIRTAL
ncbi:NAD(P)H dehydrogenase (quinone) [Micromonospora phaseoli]|uniref:NAD(P)H dehydrogenase (Quinone) n=1 Tax=Micromonospora phaseoli TaxID=1144548 RepID=A0A1H6ZGM5_9ACTN|nr:SDR family oxidoreductase [Micromonospora phaseoli]PZV97248.1 NAD(P)H dehydrogenase (quinone) [Micromonospora phaseoli]GIJ77173.1 NAD(P)-dependent oxidoreductase [Micromonospora phaseoli]SEJ51846.1 NAD(P)H dehydrogenase (quinone) [Micromonospora phaseoli]